MIKRGMVVSGMDVYIYAYDVLSGKGFSLLSLSRIVYSVLKSSHLINIAFVFSFA